MFQQRQPLICASMDWNWYQLLVWDCERLWCWREFQNEIQQILYDPWNRTKCIRFRPLPTDCTFVLMSLSSCTKSLAERITVRHRKLRRHFTAHRKCCGVDYGFSQINATSPIGKVIRVRHTAIHSQFFHVHKCVNDSLREIELFISQVDFQAQG